MRVIVSLGLWTPYRPEGELTAARVVDQRVEISSAQQGLMQLLRIDGIPYSITIQPMTTPQLGLDLPTLGTLARVQAALEGLRNWDNRPGGLILGVTADEPLGSSMGTMAPIGDTTSMLPIGYAYDPVASDVVAMQQLALDAGTPPVLIGVEDPVVGDWGTNGSGADAFLVVTAAPLGPDIVTLGAETPEAQTTTAPPAAAGIVPDAWGMGTWLLIGVAAWLLLKK